MLAEDGQVESALEEIAKVSSSIQRLCSISSTTSGGSSEQIASSWMELPIFQEPDIKCLLMNVFLMKEPKLAPAA